MINKKENTISIELSQQVGGIAVRDARGKTVDQEIVSGKYAKDDLMPTIESAMNELNLRPADLSLVVVSVGPGGFTGLRTATTIAKMIAFTTGATVVPVPSAIVAAATSGLGSGPFLVVSSVKKEEFWLSKVERSGGKWTCNASLSSSKELETMLHGVVGVFADEFLPQISRQRLEKKNISIHDVKLSAKVLLEIGLELFENGQSVEAAELLPLYPRDPEAVRIWNRRRTDA